MKSGSSDTIPASTSGDASAGTTAPPRSTPTIQQGPQTPSSSLGRWLQDQRPKNYWRVFVAGLVGYVVSLQVLNSTNNPNVAPLVMFLASALVPITFVVFCWEQGAFVDMSLMVVGIAFASGATAGLIMAAILEPTFVQGSGFGQGILIGICEETAKVVAVLWFLRDRRLRSELDGLVLGAAVGMGFAALETAGYGFHYFLVGFVASGGSFPAGVKVMADTLNLRMALAIFGHGVWTAIICAAIWRERDMAVFRLTSGVLLAYAISVTLHALWDADDTQILKVFIGVAGLVVLRFFIIESLVRVRVGPAAPLPPLTRALGYYVEHVMERQPYPDLAAQPGASSAPPAPSSGGFGSPPAASAAGSPPATHDAVVIVAPPPGHGPSPRATAPSLAQAPSAPAYRAELSPPTPRAHESDARPDTPGDVAG